MEILDPGHDYKLQNYNGDGEQRITFLKRIGEGYPGNEGEPYKGTNCQEVLRVLINRVEYLQGQIPCKDNELILSALKTSFWLFEKRAAERHGIDFPYSIYHPDDLYKYPTGMDGHVYTALFQPLVDEAYGFQPWRKDE